ncbi:MAG: glycosyltransferase family 2 protein [Deltaproteobacteria bacterium]|nr:glycosyltransferase family 2 protein [Deltaproteobacteria bacterium]
MKTSIVIVSFNTKYYLHRCLDSIRRYPPSVSHEIIVVDNASGDGSPEMVASLFPEVTLIRSSKNLGFAAANNLAIKVAGGELILFFNSDAELLPESLEPLVKHFEMNPETGIVGPTEQFESGDPYPTICPSPNLSFVFFNHTGLRRRFNRNRLINPYRSLWEQSQKSKVPTEVDWLSGASLMIRRKVLDETGFFDEKYFFYMEETDLCERARRSGWKVKFIPEAQVIHHGGQSTVNTKSGLLTLSGAISELYFFKKFRSRVEVLLLAGLLGVEYSFKLLITRGNDPRRWAYRKILRTVFGYRPVRVTMEDIY